MKGLRNKSEETQRQTTAGSCHPAEGQREEVGFLELGPRSSDGKCPMRTGVIKKTQPLPPKTDREVPEPLLAAHPPISHQCLLLAKSRQRLFDAESGKGLQQLSVPL